MGQVYAPKPPTVAVHKWDGDLSAVDAFLAETTGVDCEAIRNAGYAGPVSVVDQVGSRDYGSLVHVSVSEPIRKGEYLGIASNGEASKLTDADLESDYVTHPDKPAEAVVEDSATADKDAQIADLQAQIAALQAQSVA